MIPDQRSVTDQLQDLIRIANRNGLYDAADWIQSRLLIYEQKQDAAKP